MDPSIDFSPRLYHEVEDHHYHSGDDGYFDGPLVATSLANASNIMAQQQQQQRDPGSSAANGSSPMLLNGASASSDSDDDDDGGASRAARALMQWEDTGAHGHALTAALNQMRKNKHFCDVVLQVRDPFFSFFCEDFPDERNVCERANSCGLLCCYARHVEEPKP